MLPASCTAVDVKIVKSDEDKVEDSMYQIDFKKPEHVHFIGIGGISMSGLAEILMDEGFTVSGSDSHKSDLTEHLEAKGAQVFYGQRASCMVRV